LPGRRAPPPKHKGSRKSISPQRTQRAPRDVCRLGSNRAPTVRERSGFPRSNRAPTVRERSGLTRQKSLTSKTQRLQERHLTTENTESTEGSVQVGIRVQGSPPRSPSPRRPVSIRAPTVRERSGFTRQKSPTPKTQRLQEKHLTTENTESTEGGSGTCKAGSPRSSKRARRRGVSHHQGTEAGREEGCASKAAPFSPYGSPRYFLCQLPGAICLAHQPTLLDCPRSLHLPSPSPGSQSVRAAAPHDTNRGERKRQS